MIEDLVQIRLLGEKKRPENERFRRYLKSHDHSDRRLRRMAEELRTTGTYRTMEGAPSHADVNCMMG